MRKIKSLPKLRHCIKKANRYHSQKLRCSTLATILVAGLTTVSSASAEEYVERTGNFAIPVPTPECDGFVDYLEDGGVFFVDGVEYLGEKTINTTLGMTELLLEGNPDALIDEVNQSFEDAASAAATLVKYTPMALLSVIVDVLPEGKVTTFLDMGVEFTNSLKEAVASGVIEGLNPIKVVDTALKDLDEISGDLLKVLVNLDDPLSAGNEFLKLNQKWRGAGALTYIFTEKDPVTGMKKALGALHRQAEIVATYAGPKGKAAAALLDHTMNESKKFIDSLPDGEEKKTAALFAAAFAVTFKKQLSDPNFRFSNSVSRHPFYSAKLTNVNTKWLGDDHNSGSKYDWGFVHPVVEDKPGCISLGDYAYPGRDNPTRLNAVCNVEDGRNVWWSRPVDYKLVWGDNCSGGTHDRSVWQPVCPEGYTGVGFVASGNSHQKPLPNQIACLKTDTDLLNVTNGHAAGLKWVASDEDSGAKFDLTVYNRNFLGMQLMHAVPRDLAPDNPEYASYKVAVPTAGQPPSYNKAHCVNFYTEPDFKGWTHEACAIGETQSLKGVNQQMVRDGISSFQCGDEVAAVELFSNTLGSKVFYCHSSNNNFLHGFDNFGFLAKTYASFTTHLGIEVLSSAAKARKEADEAAAAEALRVAPVLFEFETMSADAGGRGAGTIEVSQEPVSAVGGNYYTPGDIVTITAIPTARSEFQNWTGDAEQCGSNPSCEITFASYVGINVQAIFKPKPTLTVFNVGGGKTVNGTKVPGGTITVSPEGLPCNTLNYTCQAYSTGQQVTLTAEAREGTVFDRWRGDSDCADGNVLLTEDLRCEAIFKYTSYELTVDRTEGVEITSDTSGEIDCGTLNDCSEVYQVSDGEQTRVLRAKIADDFTFVRWSGLYDCYDEDERDDDPLSTRIKVGTKNVQCQVVAVPAGTEYALTVEKFGGGTVTAEALPEITADGIDCSLNACSQSYLVNTQVKLTAKASRGSEFVGFESPDVGSDDYRKEDDDCIDGQISMTANVSCTASFKTKVLVVNGDYDSRSKEQNPYISVLRNQDLVDYDIWHVQNPNSGDNSTSENNVKRVEPMAEDLANYGRVIWYTGDASDDRASSSPTAGPSAEAEAALAAYLDEGGCLLMSSPEYYKDRGLTPFMQNYLGIAEIKTQDVMESYVQGIGEARFGFSEISADSYKGTQSEGYFGITNNTNGKFLSDALVHNPDISGADAIFAYRESGDEAAIALDNGIYRTMFFGFPFLAIPSGERQNNTMRAFLDFCGQPDSDDVFEVNDEINSAVERSGHVVLKHLRIMPDNDDYFSWLSDWFADTAVKIDFKHRRGDLNLAIYDENGSLIEASQSQNDDEELIIEDTSPDEKYLVRVFGASSSDTNTYSLTISQAGDLDFDHDGVPDVTDAFPEDPSEQYDNDGDLLGDNADPDDDNDGLPDAYELANGFNPLVASDTFEDDSDSDGYSDFSEYLADTDPNDPESTPTELALEYFLVELDSDFDGMADSIDPDDDDDKLPDVYELANQLDPLDAADAALDRDNDGLSNLSEFRLGTDINKADTDGDDIPDNIDNNPLVFDQVEQTLYSGKLLILPDMTADGVKELGVLSVNTELSQVQFELLDGKSQKSIRTLIWNDIYTDATLGVQVIDDMNGNAVSEVGLFGVRDSANNEGKPQMFVRDLLTGNRVNVFNWPANWKQSRAVVLSDMTDDGIPEIALQGRFKEGNRPQLVVKDGASTATIETFGYPNLFLDPQFYQHSDMDNDGVSEISTFGRIARNNKIQVKVASGVDSKSRLKAYNFPDKWDNVSWVRLDDSNGDDIDDWGLFGTNKQDGRPQLIVKNGTNPIGALRLHAWPAQIQSAKFFAVPDMNGDGVDEVAAAGLRTNGRHQFQIQDGVDRNSVLANYNLNLNLQDVSYHVLADLTGDGLVEIGFMGINNAGEYQLVIRNGNSALGQLRVENLGSDWSQAPLISTLGDTNNDGISNLLISGQRANLDTLGIVSM